MTAAMPWHRTAHRTADAHPRLTGRTGFEIELLAPPGGSRADLAAELAQGCGGTVRRFFHTDSEPSLVPGMDHFIHLTPGFAVVGPDGDERCRLVDDITIRFDLDPAAPPRPGWYRIVGDEPRLMRLTRRLADPAAPLETVLEPLAATFGVPAQFVDGVVRVEDEGGATVAMAVPTSGERERPCEIVTPPLTHDHQDRLEQLLEPAARLGFTVPAEAAVHLHVDAAPLRDPATFANLVRLFSDWSAPLRAALGTNPRCRRLGALPEAVVELVAAGVPDRWPDLVAAVRTSGLTKFADVNLTALMHPRQEKDTVEIRCLPGSADAEEIAARAAFVERLLDRCRDPRPLPPSEPGATAADLITLSPSGHAR